MATDCQMHTTEIKLDFELTYVNTKNESNDQANYNNYHQKKGSRIKRQPDVITGQRCIKYNKNSNKLFQITH